MIALWLGCAVPVGPTLDRPAWTGSIDRDGEPVDYLGHVPWDEGLSYPGHDHSLGAIAGLETDDRSLVSWLSLRMWHFDLAIADQQTELPILSQSEMDNSTAGVVLDYVESIPEDGESDLEHAYVSMHSWNRGGDTFGSLTITETDWATTLEAQLVAEIDDPDMPPRSFDVTVRWVAEP